MTNGKEPPVDMEWLVNQIGHALRNPIFAATVQLDAISLRCSDDPDLSKYINHLSSQLRRLDAMVEQMLQYGRPAQINCERLAVGELVRSVVTPYTSGDDAALIEVRVEPLDLVVSTDANALRTVLSSLLDNAVQHTSPPHEIELEVTELDDDTVTIRVVDHGVGISPDIMPRVFVPFFPQHRGRCGLGLAIARKLAQALGGHIALSSQEGQGTEATVTLPMSAT
jgi:signal transduction histidine kinase